MDKYKLEKFNAKCAECGGRAIAEVEIYNEKYIYNLEQNLNNLQQLKDEIAALAINYTPPCVDDFDYEVVLMDLIGKLRKLSTI